jgi:hypothetical protein
MIANLFFISTQRSPRGLQNPRAKQQRAMPTSNDNSDDRFVGGIKGKDTEVSASRE